MSDARLLYLEISGWSNPLDVDTVQAHRITVSLSAGEHLCIVGPSGCGKSTLLKRIADAAAQYQTAEGTVSTGLLLQEGALLDHLTVRQNLELIVRHGVGAPTADAIFNCIDALKLPVELLDRRVSELSGGQLRRVAIARALLLQPQVMLYDEPDAGLDLVNLMSLGSLVNGLLSTTAGKRSAAITVSHNPIYIAHSATRVVELRDGELHTLFDWSTPPQSAAQLEQRLGLLMAKLAELVHAPTSTSVPALRQHQPRTGWRGAVFRTKQFFNSVGAVIKGTTQSSRSGWDQVRVFWFGLNLAFFSGAVFFALVGLMLGATTMAVVKLLTDTALQGWIAWFVSPHDIVALMGGRYALYLGPAVGSMLFAARSGSLAANWLGELQRSRQLEALHYLQVPIYAYVVTPMLIATVVAAALTGAWFTLAVWLGGVLSARELFGLVDAASMLAITQVDLELSQILLKLGLYSVCLGVLIISFAMQPKHSNRAVNQHTTSAIVWSTIVVALFELVIILY